MTFVFRPPQRRLLPVGPLKIDWSHPLTNGLMACYVPGVMGGINLVGNGGNIIGGTTADFWSNSVEGPSARIVASDSQLLGPAPASWAASTEFSIYTRYFVSGSTLGANPRMAAIEPNNTNGSPFCLVCILSLSSALSVAWNTGGSFTSVGFGTSWTANTVKSLGATFKVNGSVITYDGGVSVGTGASFGASAPTSTVPTVLIGGLTTGGSNVVNGNNFISCFWNRVLSADEMAAIDADPYCFLTQEAELPMMPPTTMFQVSGRNGGVARRRPFNALKQSNLLYDGLIAWLTFDGGSCVDLSGNQNNGTLQGSPTFTDTPYGGAAVFAGAQGIALPNQAPLNTMGTNPSTLAAWVNLTTTQDGVIIGKYASGREAFHLRNNRAANNKIECRIVIGATTPYSVLTTTLCSDIVGKWTHVVGVADGTNLNIYVNAVREGQSAYTAGSCENSQFSIGKDVTNNGTYLVGAVADARVYNRALTAEEIYALYVEEKPSFGLGRELPLAPVFIVSVTLFLRPDGDSSIGGWTNEVGSTSNLFQSIDETSFNDADYIQSSVNPNVDIVKISLSNPAAGATSPIKVRYRYKANVAAPIDLTVRLLQGVTQIASWSHVGVSTTFTTAEQTLSAPEVASISNFSDLYLEFTADT